MRPFFILLLLTISTCYNCLAQGKVFGQLYTTNAYPTYDLSSDGTTLAVSSVSEQPKNRWLSFIDLETFTYKPQGSVSLVYSSITPDFKSAFGNEFNTNGFKGSTGWQPYKKYMSWFYPSSTDSKNLQWSDKHFILAVRSDGNLLAAGKVEHVSKKTTAYYSFHDLQIVDPRSGLILSTLRKGEFMQVGKLWPPEENPVLLNNDSLLLWRTWSDISSMNVYAGKRNYFRTSFPLHAINGKWAMGLKIDDRSQAGNLAIKKTIINMETGDIVYDKSIAIKNANGFWCAADNSNRFFTLNGLNSILYEEEWTGSELKVVDSMQLDIKDVLKHKVWLSHITDYKLLVSKKLGKVLLLPLTWPKWNNDNNEIYMWNINSGALVHRNPKYIRPNTEFLAKNGTQNAEPIRPATLPLNALVRKKGGGPYFVLVSQDVNTKNWWVSRFIPKGGSYELVNESRNESEFSTFTTDVISTTPCSACNGAGKVNVAGTRTTKKTDKMIYTQITTTKTEAVNNLKSCSQCKGLGFTGVL